MDIRDAKRVSFGTVNFTLPANAPTMSVDSLPTLPDEIWIVDAASLLWQTNGVSNPTIAVAQNLSGIYLCPPGTGPLSPNDFMPSTGPGGQVPPQQTTRPLLLPSNKPNFGVDMHSAVDGGTGGITIWVSKGFVVPPGSFLRGVFTGYQEIGDFFAGTTLTMSWTYARHKISECDPIPVCVV